MLARVNFNNPLFWAVLIGWILSVVLHEFAHGLVAYWGGDYTIRERGGLTLNPLQYVDPVFSILLPIVFLCMGGIPLPGGVTYVRRDLLRSRGWDSAVSLAGPTMNILLFFACIIPLHPHFGWLDTSFDPASGELFANATGAQIFLAVTAFLQLLAAVFNLFPVPPLDGFQTIGPWIPREMRIKLGTPPVSNILLFVFFIAIWKLDFVQIVFEHVMAPLLDAMGFGTSTDFFYHAFYRLFQ